MNRAALFAEIGANSKYRKCEIIDVVPARIRIRDAL